MSSVPISLVNHNTRISKLEYRIKSLTTRLQMMQIKVVQATTQVDKSSSKLHQVETRKFQVSLEFSSSFQTPPVLSPITNFCALLQTTTTGSNKSIETRLQLLIALLESLHKEEQDLIEDLRIAYESCIGIKQVVRAMDLVLN